MTATHTYIKVILPLRIEWEPYYSVETPEKIRIGSRVRVMFSGRIYNAVVSSISEAPPENMRIRPILSVETELPDISEEEIRFWKTIAGYYMCSIGEVYKAAYPSVKISQEKIHAKKILREREKSEAKLSELKAKAEKTERLIADKNSVLSEKTEEERIKGKAERKATIALKERIARLTENLLSVKEEIASMEKCLAEANRLYGNMKNPVGGGTDKIVLSEYQQVAFDGIMDAFRRKKTVLLHGVTGSGKTEIYTKLAARTLAEGRNVLYLVPEIAVSRQLEERIASSVGHELLVFHSGETSATRNATAEAIRKCAADGNTYMVLGTRSSLFLPHNRLGLVIVDEEHDRSYKQDSPAPRYNGRDSAIMLAAIHGSNVILGSATPSLESLFNVKYGKFEAVRLEKRFYNSEDAEIELIDTIAERKKNGMKGVFSLKLIKEIRSTLEKGEQVIIFRSRKSYSPVLQCSECGKMIKCPKCGVGLSLHKHPDSMVCHHCGFTAEYNGKCPDCGGRLIGIGAGTQKIEEEARSLFPDARIDRLDGDTARNRNAEMETIRDFGNGKTDILIGTQIITKGFDFPKLTLTAVISADSILGIQDFRADEKAFQILEQFRGRCARRDRKGKFLIQTAQPEHPVYKKLMQNDGGDLYSGLMDERKQFGFPPFSRIINIIVRDTDRQRCENMAWSLSADLRKALPQQDSGKEDTFPAIHAEKEETVTGPFTPEIEKADDNYIRIIRISLGKDRNLSQNKEKVRKVMENFHKNYREHLTIDVDPL